MTMRFNIYTRLTAILLVLVLLMVPLAISISNISERSLKKVIGDEEVRVAETIMSRIDFNIFTKIHELGLLDEEPIIMESLDASNKDYSNRSDMEEFIENVDANWTRSGSQIITQTGQEIISNPLSEYLTSKFLDHNLIEHGYSVYGQVAALNKFGVVIGMTSKTENFDNSNETWWVDALSNRTSVEDASFVNIGRTDSMSISMRIDLEGSLIGMVHARIDVTIIARESEISIQGSHHHSIRLISSSGRMIYGTETFRFLEDVSSEPYYSSIDDEKGYFTAKHKGRQRLFSYATSKGYEDFTGLGWIIVIDEDLDEALAPASEVRESMLTSALIFIFAGVIIAMLFARSLSKPIKEMSHTAREIANGDLDKRVSIKQRNEVGELADSFNAMTAKLQSTHSLLEEKVAQRTAELKTVNLSLQQERDISDEIINSLPGIFYMLNIKGQFRRWNSNLMKVSGYTETEMESINALDFFKGSDKDLIKGRIAEVFKRGESWAEADLRTKNGIGIPYYFTGKRVTFGKRPYLIGTGLDMSRLYEAEDAIRASEEKFRSLSESSLTGIFIIQDGIIKYANPAVGEIFGYDVEELIERKGPTDLTAEEDHEASLNYIFGRFEADAESEIFSFYGRKKDGTTIDCEVLATATMYEDSPAIIGTILDVSDRNQAMRELVASEGRLITLLDSMQPGVLVIDAESREIVDVNPSAAEMIGRPREEIRGNVCHKFICPSEGQSCPICDLDQIIDRSERTLINAGGEKVPILKTVTQIELDGKPHLLETFIDISEQKQAEDERLRAVTERAAIIDSIGEGLVIIGSDGKLQSVNPAMATLTGFDTQEFIGHGVEELILSMVSEDEIESTLENFAVMSTTSSSHDIPISIKRSDGTTIKMLFTTQPIRDERGSMVKLIVTARDVTGLVDAQEKLEAAMDQVQDKNRELEQIIYAASHDLRSPLVNIQGFSNELEISIRGLKESLAGIDLPDDVRERITRNIDDDIGESLEFILGSISKMDGLLSGLLRLSRSGRQAIQPRVLDMNHLLSEVVRGHEFEAKENDVQILVEDLPPCLADPVLVDQVFSNLVVNAIRYRDQSRRGRIRVSGEEVSGESIYTVEDNGVGMRPDDCERVFEIFHRLDPDTTPGEGLGLTIARKIIGSLHGRIWAESEIGEGSRFHVVLPAGKSNGGKPDEE